MFFVAAHPARGAARIAVEDVAALPARRELKPEFTVRSVSPGNLLTLDRCRYRVDGGAWIRDDVSVIQGRLLNLKRDCDLELEFEFATGDSFDLATPLTLVSETPERFEYSLNGKPFPAVDGGACFDEAFRRIALPGNLRRGVNVIGMKTRYHQEPEVYAALERARKFETEYNKLTFDSEIESVYLLGNFTVNHAGRVEPLTRLAERFHGEFTLGAPAEGAAADARDLVRAGFPFFAGKLTLGGSFDLTAEEAETLRYLRFAPFGANSYRVRINGDEAGFLYNGKFAVSVAGMLRAGRNTLELELTTSLRNMLGPHHLAEGESYAVHTLSFNREANAVGWSAPPYDEGYCFVRLGLDRIELV